MPKLLHDLSCGNQSIYKLNSDVNKRETRANKDTRHYKDQSIYGYNKLVVLETIFRMSNIY